MSLTRAAAAAAGPGPSLVPAHHRIPAARVLEQGQPDRLLYAQSCDPQRSPPGVGTCAVGRRKVKGTPRRDQRDRHRFSIPRSLGQRRSTCLAGTSVTGTFWFPFSDMWVPQFHPWQDHTDFWRFHRGPLCVGLDGECAVGL